MIRTGLHSCETCHTADNFGVALTIADYTLIDADGTLWGDNNDVWRPDSDVVWTGVVSGICGGSGGKRNLGPIKKVTLILDGVFFDDGEFAGPNQSGLWEQIVLSAEAHMRLARIARQAHDGGSPPQEIFRQIEAVTGRLTDRPPLPQLPGGPRSTEMYRDSELQSVAWKVGMSRKHEGDDRTIAMLLGWGDVPLAHFRKL
jgi:hypothetical protein